jgi:hypothetical protein
MADIQQILADVGGPAGALLGLLFGGSDPSLSSKLLQQFSQTGGTTSQATAGKTSTRRNLSPGQVQLDGITSQTISKMLADPNQFLAPQRQAAADTINQSYAQAPQAIASKLLAFGGTNSGKFGKAVTQSELSRNAALAKNDSDFATAGSALQLQAGDLASKLLGIDYGSDSSTSGSTRQNTSSSTSSSTLQQQAGDSDQDGALTEMFDRMKIPVNARGELATQIDRLKRRSAAGVSGGSGGWA